MGLTAANLTYGWPLTAERRTSLALAAATASRLALSGAIILSPFHARIVLEERPLVPVFDDYRDLLLFWNEILVIAALAFWAVGLACQPRRLDLGPLLIRVPVVVLLIAGFAAVPFSSDSGLALFNAIALGGFVLLALYVANEVNCVSDLAPAVAVMIAVQAIVAIGQVLNQGSLGLSDLGELHLDPQVPGVSILWTQGAPSLLRGYGLSDHPNILGGVLAASLLLLAAGFHRFRDGPLAVLCAVFGLGAAAMLLTFSRSALLALAVGFGFGLVTLTMRRDWRVAGLWLGAGLVALLLAVPLLSPYTDYLVARVNPGVQPVGSTEERSLSERAALARNTNEIFVDHPLLGVGIGVLPTAMKQSFPDHPYDYAPAHVVILVVAAETGLFGAAAFGTLVLAPWLLLLLCRRLTPELIGTSAVLLALDVISLLDYYPWSLTAGRIWFWLTLALWVVAYRRAFDRTSDA